MPDTGETFNDTYDHCLSIVPSVMKNARKGDFQGAAEMLVAQDFRWWFGLHAYLKSEDLAASEKEASDLVERAVLLPGIPACEQCHATDTARIVFRDATGWNDDPDDFGGEYPSDYDPSPLTAADIFCGGCGFSTGTSIKSTRPEAKAVAIRYWSFLEEDEGIS